MHIFARHYKNTDEIVKKLLWQDRIVKKSNGCWIWQGAKDKPGWYGKLRWNGKYIRTHRASYTLAFGPIPENKVVMHVCDEPRCVNPAHLKLGTHSENFKDMHRKNRHRGFVFRKGHKGYGGHTPGWVLNEILAEAIRDLIQKCNWSYGAVAKGFGINKVTVYRIIEGRTWRRKLAQE